MSDKLDERDLRIDGFRNGAGLARWARVTHLPTGLTVFKDEHESNWKNRKAAIEELANTLNAALAIHAKR